MAAARRAEIGMLVFHSAAEGVARVGAVDSNRVRLDLFDSAAVPIASQIWVDCAGTKRCQLDSQTRVYWQDRVMNHWRAGRIVGGGPDEYFVRPPNAQFDIRVPEVDLRVRWDRPVTDPLEVLLAGAQETPYYRDSRLPVLRDLTAQRSACASVTAFPSSRIQIHAHQINVALKVLSDPVQRYLLADEVGLGKTIEAGFVIRQRFIDDRNAKVCVLAPEALRRQWREELLERFFIDDFPTGRLVVASHDEPDKWARYHDYDLVVVDEAHRLSGSGDHTASPYVELKDLCHSVPRLLLLSATPVLQRESTHLGLLHLLDPNVFSWDRAESFQQRLTVRRDLARAVFALDPLYPYLLPSAIDQVRRLLPADRRFEDLAREVISQLDGDGDLLQGATENDLAAFVAGLRGHVAETYRLHRRVLRNRRETVLKARLDDEGAVAPFDVTGRRPARLVALESAAQVRGRAIVESWQVQVRDHLLNTSAEDTLAYARVLAVMVARLGGPLGDLRDVLIWRVSADTQAKLNAGLTVRELEAIDRAPRLPFEADLVAALRDALDDDGLLEMVERLKPALLARRAVVFAGRGQLATTLATALRETGCRTVGEHTHAVGAEVAEKATLDWREHGGILICDASAEDGRNFQLADLAIHLRLPTNPNELEQRIGRVDRYGGSKPAAQLIFGDRRRTGLSSAWREMLTDGFHIFEQSISALQDTVDQGQDGIWIKALEEGVAGLIDAVPAVAEGLREELKTLTQLDVLEASYDSASPERDLPLALARNEVRVDAGAPLMKLLAGDDGFRFYLRESEVGKVSVQHGSRAPLLGPRLLARLLAAPDVSRTGWTDRWQALKHGGRIFRVGNPLVDAVAEILAMDDRGMASAHWRVDPTWSLDPLAYFGFDFLVETDLAPALAAAQVRGLDSKSELRRRGDRAFGPFHRRIWIPSNETTAEEDVSVLRWLDAPYRANAHDVNLNSERIADLYRLFGGVDSFESSTREVEAIARKELHRVTDLLTRTASSSAVLMEELAVVAAQAAARRLAASLLVDDESAAIDYELGSALVRGIEGPSVRLVAITCLVRSSKPWGAA